MITTRLPWRLRARPSATLHEIQSLLKSGANLGTDHTRHKGVCQGSEPALCGLCLLPMGESVSGARVDFEAILLEQVGYGGSLEEGEERACRVLVLRRAESYAGLFDGWIGIGRDFGEAALVFHGGDRASESAMIPTSAAPVTTNEAVCEMFSPRTNLSFSLSYSPCFWSAATAAWP